MIRIPRWLVGVLGTLFALFHAGLGFSNIPSGWGYAIGASMLLAWQLWQVGQVWKERRRILDNNITESDQ